MQELVKHIVSNNKQIQKQLKIVDIEQYTQQNQKVYKQLDADIKRGLLRFKSLLFNENYSESFYTQQQIFQQYFLLLWVNFPKSLQKSYYQGFTDIFETMFISLVSTDKIVCDQTTKCILQSLSSYIQIPNAILNYSMQVVNKNKYKFTYGFCEQVAHKTLKYLQIFDPISYFILQSIQPEIKINLLTKFSINCCLHETNLPNLSCVLTHFFLEQPDSVQAMLIQTIISISARVFVPYCFDGSESDLLFGFKKRLIQNENFQRLNDPFDIAMQFLNEAVKFVLQNERNEEELIVLVNNIKNNYKTYLNRQTYQI
ncbi:Conserved_hypothetical protein [Hexamita inflata]|uniref:Uncharacterized protein n=1 Tax=Hexamita inflata TaxID=28002 RepID=A0AA86QZZ5_9EUKA|nr:Conserved hypothetical protein [Hexamita inflata]